MPPLFASALQLIDWAWFNVCTNTIGYTAVVSGTERGSIFIPASTESTGIYHDSVKQPDGVSLVPWQSGRTLACDVTVTTTLAASQLLPLLQSVNKLPGSQRSRLKHNYYHCLYGLWKSPSLDVSIASAISICLVYKGSIRTCRRQRVTGRGP